MVDLEKVRVLDANRERFLAFLRPRVGSADVAEEILQDAYLKAIEKIASVRDEEIAWFYRLLRNAVVDHYRRRGAEQRGRERYGVESVATEPSATTEGTVCACVNDVLPTLKPEYAQVLRSVEMEGQSVAQAAAALGVTANNAAVRVHRARAALHKELVQTCGACSETGCLDCTCGPTKSDAGV